MLYLMKVHILPAVCFAFLPCCELQATIPGAGPIVFKEGSFMEKDYLRNRLEWVKKDILPTARLSWRGCAWEPLAEDFWPKAASAWVEKSRAMITFAELVRQASTLFSRGCDDPFMCFLFHLCFFEGGKNWSDGLDPLRLSLIKQESLDRAAVIGCWGLVQELNWFHQRGLTSPERQKKLVEWMIRATNDQSYSEEFAEIFVRDQLDWLDTIKDQPPETLLRLIQTWQASRWPSWVKLTLTGAAEIKWAWMLRGSGKASTVSPEGWMGFLEHLANANQALEQSCKLRPDRPEAAALMITVARGQGLPLTISRKWFDQSIAAQFDYMKAYDSLLSFYTPRWGGSAELVIEFGKACAKTRLYDTFVPAILYQACRSVAKESGNPPAIFSHSFIAESVMQTTKGYLQHKTESVPWNKNLAAMCAVSAWLADEPHAAAAHLATLGSTPFSSHTMSMMSDFSLHERGVRLSVAAASSPLGPVVQKLEALINRGRFDEVLAALQKIDLTAIPDGTAVRDYLTEKKDMAEFAGKLAQGGWHPVPIHPGLSNFISSEGAWAVSSEGCLLLHGDDLKRADLTLNLPMPENIQIRGEFVYEATSSDGFQLAWSVGPALTWKVINTGYEPLSAGVRGMLTSGGKHADEAFIAADGIGQQSSSQPVKLQHVNSFDLRFKQGQATLTANGETIVTLGDDMSPLAKPKKGRIGVIASRIASGAKVTVRNLALRIPE